MIGWKFNYFLNSALVFYPVVCVWFFPLMQVLSAKIYAWYWIFFVPFKSQAHVKIHDIDSLDDVDQCIIYYNQAVVYYHTRKYGQALTITEKLYTFLEPLGM